MRVGYVRVSSVDQNEARQMELMESMNVDKIYVDKASGKNIERTELKKLLSFVRKGDVVIVESISRWARNTKDFLNLMDILKEKEVDFMSTKESIDTSSSTGKFIMIVFAALYELERENILDRQREGILIAKAQKGKYKGRKKIVNKDFELYYKKWKNGEITATEAMNKMGLKRNTFYRRASEMKGVQ